MSESEATVKLNQVRITGAVTRIEMDLGWRLQIMSPIPALPHLGGRRSSELLPRRVRSRTLKWGAIYLDSLF